MTSNGTDKHRMRGSAVDLLAHEDWELVDQFRELTAARGRRSVEARADYGDLATLLTRHAAAREAALMDVIKAFHDVPELADVTDRMHRDSPRRRAATDGVAMLSRGGTGLDFDSTLANFERVIAPEVEWEVVVAIPTIRSAIRRSPHLQDRLHRARYLVRHAPHQDAPGQGDRRSSRWYERAPVFSKVLARRGGAGATPRELEQVGQGASGPEGAPPE